MLKCFYLCRLSIWYSNWMNAAAAADAVVVCHCIGKHWHTKHFKKDFCFALLGILIQCSVSFRFDNSTNYCIIQCSSARRTEQNEREKREEKREKSELMLNYVHIFSTDWHANCWLTHILIQTISAFHSFDVSADNRKRAKITITSVDIYC